MEAEKLGNPISTRLPERVEKWLRERAANEDRKPAWVLRKLAEEAKDREVR